MKGLYRDESHLLQPAAPSTAARPTRSRKAPPPSPDEEKTAIGELKPEGPPVLMKRVARSSFRAHQDTRAMLTANIALEGTNLEGSPARIAREAVKPYFNYPPDKNNNVFIPGHEHYYFEHFFSMPTSASVKGNAAKMKKHLDDIKRSK